MSDSDKHLDIGYSVLDIGYSYFKYIEYIDPLKTQKSQNFCNQGN